MSVPIVEALRAPRGFARHVRARNRDMQELHARAGAARIRSRWLVASLALFAAVSAIAGGFGLVASRPGDTLVPSALLALAFTPGPLVDESTPLLSHVALWGSGGLLMAYVMSIITWCGVRRLRR